MVDKERDIIISMPQRRDGDREDVQPVIQIIPEPALGDLLRQIPARRGKDSHIYFPGTGAPQPLEFPFLNDTQQLCLQFQGQFADLVQEDRSLVGYFEPSHLQRMGPGEGPFLPAEEFAFDQVGRKGGAIHRDERPVLSQTPAMNGMGNHSLARPSLPQNKDRSVGACNLIHPEHDIPKGVALTDDLVEVELHFDIFTEIDVLGLKLLFQPPYLG